MRAWPRSASACNTPSREPARLGSGLVTFAYYANIPFNSGFVNSQIRFQMAVGSGAFRPVRAFRDRCDLDCRLVDPKPLRRPNIGGPVPVVVPELQIAATIDCFNAPISRCWPCRFTVRATVIPRLRPGPAKPARSRTDDPAIATTQSLSATYLAVGFVYFYCKIAMKSCCRLRKGARFLWSRETAERTEPRWSDELCCRPCGLPRSPERLWLHCAGALGSSAP
jgi:hypothetical protein